MVTSVVLISALGGVANQALKTRQAALQNRPTATGSDPEALLREIASLRQRVAALEAIVTEPSFELQRKFRDLERESRSGP